MLFCQSFLRVLRVQVTRILGSSIEMSRTFGTNRYLSEMVLVVEQGVAITGGARLFVRKKILNPKGVIFCFSRVSQSIANFQSFSLFRYISILRMFIASGGPMAGAQTRIRLG